MKKGNLLNKTICLVIALSFLFIMLLSGCSSSKPNNTDKTPSSNLTTEGPQLGGVLTIAVNQDATTLSHLTVPPLESYIMSLPALETLGRFDSEGRMLPYLAKSWDVDADNKTITINLNKGIKFHDGTDFNAEAVKWNLETYTAAGRGEVRSVASIDIIDDHTLRLNLSEWNSSIVDSLGYFIPMMSPTAFEKNGKDLAARNPVGTGPFEFVSWERDVALTYKKFDNYWQEGLPYLDGIEFKVIKDPLTTSASFRAKEVDAYIGLPTQTASELQKSGFEVKKLETGLGSMIRGIVLNSANPNSPFADLRVRQAVGHAIDNQAIVESLLYGFVIPTNQWAVPGVWSYNSNVKGYPFNPEKAKKLLADAGYANGFETKIIVQNVPEDVLVKTAIQGYLADVGIKAELEVVDRGKFNQYATETGWDGIIQFTSRSDADVAFVMPRVLSSRGSLFFMSLIHPEDVQKLLNDIRIAPDFDSKKKMALELQRLVIDEYAIIQPMFVRTLPVAKHSEVQNDGFNLTHGSVWTPEVAWLKK